MDVSLTQPAKLLLLASMLSKDRIITLNGKAFLKELILGQDPRLTQVIEAFDSNDGKDTSFVGVVQKLIDGQAMQLYDQLFSECSLERGKTTSKKEREEKGLNQRKSLIYGEVEFASFSKVLRKINPAPGGIFYDLGSGTGRAVFVARFLHDFKTCKGIEVLSGLHSVAVGNRERYESEGFREMLGYSSPGDCEFKEGSILEDDWSDGDVVFANSTCFDDDLMADIAAQGSSLKAGAYFVTFTKGLNSKDFEVVERKRYKMSWGPATVYIQRRLNDDGTSFDMEGLQEVPDDDSYKDEQDEEEDDDDDDDDELEDLDGDEDDEDDGEALDNLD